LATRQLQRDVKRFGVNFLFQRVAISEQYEGNPTRIRAEWAFSDFLGACVFLDAHSLALAEARRKAEDGARG
jgi:hypothetical protein